MLDSFSFHVSFCLKESDDLMAVSMTLIEKCMSTSLIAELYSFVYCICVGKLVPDFTNYLLGIICVTYEILVVIDCIGFDFFWRLILVPFWFTGNSCANTASFVTMLDSFSFHVSFCLEQSDDLMAVSMTLVEKCMSTCLIAKFNSFVYSIYVRKLVPNFTNYLLGIICVTNEIFIIGDSKRFD